MIGFEWALCRYVKISALILRQRCQLDAEVVEMSFCDLFIQLLGEHVDADGVLVIPDPQFDLEVDEWEDKRIHVMGIQVQVD